MRVVRVPDLGADKAWRIAARGLMAARVPPDQVLWQEGDAGPSLFGEAEEVPASGRFTVPKSFVSLAGSVVWHRDPQRYARLYEFLWRLRLDPRLMADRGDPGLARLRLLQKNVHRCAHKMKAFVRFRDIGSGDAGRRRFAAWFEPTHHTLEPTAPFFARRFGDMDWMIATPDRTAIFVDGKLEIGPGQTKPDLPEDAAEELWGTYFSNIFNPARVKLQAMTSEMPKKYWKNMPEGALIANLTREAEARQRQMQEAQPTQAPVFAQRIAARRDVVTDLAFPETEEAASLQTLKDSMTACTRCALHGPATQVVVGEGAEGARVMVVGEQPGDREDLSGRPFVGPAGQLFDKAAALAGLDRSDVYVTNAVKHFKFVPRGKRRIHQAPTSTEIGACRWWLIREIDLVGPRLIVAMGATAARSLTGSGEGILSRRGDIETTPEGRKILLTLHPAAILRTSDPEQKSRMFDQFVDDLRRAAGVLQAQDGEGGSMPISNGPDVG